MPPAVCSPVDTSGGPDSKASCVDSEPYGVYACVYQTLIKLYSVNVEIQRSLWLLLEAVTNSKGTVSDAGSTEASHSARWCR
jgi:hypothetical protein